MLTYKELLQKSKEIYQPPHKVENFMTADELEYCKNLYTELPVFEAATHNRATRKDYLMHNVDDPRMSDLFLPKLQKLFPGKKLVIDGGNFTDWHEPVKIHTDGLQLQYSSEQWYEDSQQVLGFAVLVPLTTNTGSGVAKTMFFDQCYRGKHITPGRILEIPNNPLDGLEGYTNQEFQGDYTGLDHNGLDQLYGFSLYKGLDWTYCDALVWHRSQFHCAENYTHEYTSKQHIIFLVNFDYSEEQ